MRHYLSLTLLFAPPLLFAVFVWFFRDALARQHELIGAPPWQFWLLAVAGLIATAGGVLDWRYHRDPLQLRISKKERDAEAAALGLGGLPMFALTAAATLSSRPTDFLIPILVVLIYTVVAICYDEFVFHIHRCGKTETLYHRMLVLGNGVAWLAWMHFIYC